MYAVLDMELEPVSTVLKNETCEVFVCADRTRRTDTFYTLILVEEPSVRKQVVRMIGEGQFFADNNDFLGSFTYRDNLGLVFLHREENRLSSREILYAGSFAHRKELAENFLVACAQSGVNGTVGALLIEDRNIHVTPARQVYFNYYLDFSALSFVQDDDFVGRIAQHTLRMLTRDYEDSSVVEYPGELQLMHKMVQSRSFRSLSRLITFVRDLPDDPRKARGGFGRWFERVRNFWKGRLLSTLVWVLVLITLFTLGWNLYARWAQQREAQQNTTYLGMEQIGEVTLSDKDI